MSVNRTTCIGLGWVIPKSLYCEMQRCAADRWDEIEGCFTTLDCYHADSDIFLGEAFGLIEGGEHIDLIDIIARKNAEIDEDAFSKQYIEVLRICGQEISPDSMWSEAKLYVLSFLH